MSHAQIPLSQINLDQRAQPRPFLNTNLTAEYADAMKAGAVFPPLTVFHDGEIYWLADGFHRLHAATSIGMENFDCLVTPGALREAILHSCQANAVHGLRRSDEDKRRAVKVLLADKEWATWSDREIARRCQVSHTLVARIREELTPLTGNVASEDRTFRTKHGSVATMRTAAIGLCPLVNQADLPGQAIPADIAPPAPDKRTAPKHRLSDAPPPHLAITILARSICDVSATAEEVVGGCADDEERNDLREVSVAAVTKLSEVLERSRPPAFPRSRVPRMGQERRQVVPSSRLGMNIKQAMRTQILDRNLGRRQRSRGE